MLPFSLVGGEINFPRFFFPDLSGKDKEKRTQMEDVVYK